MRYPLRNRVTEKEDAKAKQKSKKYETKRLKRGSSRREQKQKRENFRQRCVKVEGQVKGKGREKDEGRLKVEGHEKNYGHEKVEDRDKKTCDKMEGRLPDEGCIKEPNDYFCLDTRIEGDQHATDLQFIELLRVKGYAVTVVIDNSFLKSFYRENCEVHSSWIDIETFPWGMAKLGEDKVALTSPLYREIKVYAAEPKLRLDKVIKTKTGYQGIIFLNSDSFAVTSSTNTAIDILDLKGTVIRSVGVLGDPSNFGFTKDPKLKISKGGVTASMEFTSALENPSILEITKGGNILVIDNSKRALLCLKPSGEFVFEFKKEGYYPFNRVACTQSGHILLTEGFDSDRIVHLTPTGEYVKDLKLPSPLRDISDIAVQCNYLYLLVRREGVKSTTINL